MAKSDGIVISIKTEELAKKIQEMEELEADILNLAKTSGLSGVPFHGSAGASKGPSAETMGETDAKLHEDIAIFATLTEKTRIFLQDVQQHFETADGRIAQAIQQAAEKGGGNANG